MEISEIRDKRNKLEEAIEKLITQFIVDTDVEVAEIKFQPAVFTPDYREIQPVEINVDLVI